MKKKTNAKILDELKEYKIRYLKQNKFDAFPSPYTDRITPVMHTGYLMYIRGKYIFLALLRSLEDRNLYAAWILLKSYWENVGTFSYYYIKISEYIKANNGEEAFNLSSMMALGGRGFLTEEMVKKRGHEMKDFRLPGISTMLKVVDDDWEKATYNGLGFKEFYNTMIAEGGHTTFIGLDICLTKKRDKSHLPNIEKSWSKRDYSSILNFTSMSSLIFFYYWNKFYELRKTKLG